MGFEFDYCLFLGSHELRLWQSRDGRAIFLGSVADDLHWRQSLTSLAENVRHSKMVLAIDSSRLLVAKMALPISVRENRKAAVFEAERFFPFAAEEMLVAFDMDREGNAVFVAVERAWLEPYWSAFENHGAAVVAAVPASLLIALARQGEVGNKPTSVTIQIDNFREEFTFDKGKLTNWCFDTASKGVDVEEENVNSDSPSKPVQDNHADPSKNNRLSEFAFSDRIEFESAVVKRLSTLLPRSAISKWKFTARDDDRVASRHDKWYLTAVAANLLLVLLGGIGLLRSMTYANQTHVIHQEMAQMAGEYFPGQRIRSLQRHAELENERLETQLTHWEALLAESEPMRLFAKWLHAVPEQPMVELNRLELQKDFLLINGKVAQTDELSQYIRFLKDGGMQVKEEKSGLSFQLRVMDETVDRLSERNIRWIERNGETAK